MLSLKDLPKECDMKIVNLFINHQLSLDYLNTIIDVIVALEDISYNLLKKCEHEMTPELHLEL